MGKERMLAFSDGVIAIIITIMVLEMKAPHSATLEALAEVWPLFASYVLSFLYVAIYWHNHHHMLAVSGTINGAILWANTHLLFWLSLLPFTTSWVGETAFAEAIPTALYGANLLLAAIAYYVLQRVLIAHDGPDCQLARMIGSDLKGKLSPLGYVLGLGLAFVSPAAAIGAFGALALVWLIPDRRIERRLSAGDDPGRSN